MAISRFNASARGLVYKFASEEYERNGEKKTIHRVLIDQDDKVFTFNIRPELYNIVPRFTDVTLILEYVEGGASGAYLSVQNIVPFSDAPTGETAATASTPATSDAQPTGSKDIKPDNKQDTGKTSKK
jgi:hypothetical protein